MRRLIETCERTVIVEIAGWIVTALFVSSCAGAGACLEELATLPRQPQGNTHLQRWDAVS